MKKKSICSIFLLIFVILVLLIGAGIGIFVWRLYERQKQAFEKLEPLKKAAEEILREDEGENKGVSEEFSKWRDICVESVSPIAVGHTKPFFPFSPDGEWITYSNFFPPEENVKVTEPVGVYVIKTDGTEKRMVASRGVRPSFGRYHWKIVYGMPGTTGKPGYKGMPEEDIWVVNFDGTDNKCVACDAEDNKMKVYGGSSITYNGKYVVYNIMQEVDGGIGIVEIDGKNKSALVRGSGIWGYSADGKKVFVESVDKAKKGYVAGGWLDINKREIHTEKEEGIREIEWVTSIKYPDHHYGHPHVNYDGTLIAYDDPSIDAGPFDVREIWIGELDGSNKNYQLTNTPGSTFANHPRWSPDGKWIVYDEQMFTEKGVKDKVTIINLVTKQKKEIAETIVPKQSGWTEPGFSPDGKKIFFYAPDPASDGKPSIWIAELKECGK